MSDLRARKRAKNRKAILEVARRLFIEKGFSATNMEEIAERADFGVATLYNYFNSKEGIMAAMARDDMTVLKEAADTQLEHLPSDPLEAVLSLLEIYLRVYEVISDELMQEFLVRSSKGEGPLHEHLEWLRSWEKEQVVLALRHCQEIGRVVEDFDIELAARVVLDLYARSNRRLAVSKHKQDELDYLRSALALVLDGGLQQTVVDSENQRTAQQGF